MNEAELREWVKAAAELLKDAHPPTNAKGWDWKRRAVWLAEQRLLLEHAERDERENRD